MGEISKRKLYAYMIGSILFGSINVILFKLVNSGTTNSTSFDHPYFEVAVMFLGESLCFLFHLLSKKQPIKDTSLDSQGLFHIESFSEPPDTIARYGKKLFVIPALCDASASSLKLLALTFSGPSIYQMTQGIIVIVVAFYTIVFLKRPLFRHQWLGVFLTTAGLTIIGVFVGLYSDSKASDPTLGVFLLLLGNLVQGAQYIIEEKLLNTVKIEVLCAVGIEGITGICLFLVLLPIFNFLPCNNLTICDADVLENTFEAFKELGNHWEIILFLFSTLFATALLNWLSVALIKYAGAIIRAIVTSGGTLLVLIVSLMVGWENFVWEQLVGFAVMMFGALVYIEVLVLPFCGLKESVIKHQEQRNFN